MSLKKLLDEISVIPGVSGSCIFNRNEGPLCTNSDANIATDVLIKVGSFLLRMLKMGKINGLEITGSRYQFDNCTVVSTPLGPDSILLTICDTQANCSLVATTAEMLAADMEEQLQRGAAAPSPLEEEPDFKGLEPVDEETTVENLQECFGKIEDALAEAIGPVAGMILQDYIVKWKKQGPASTDRLHELVEMLLDEISEDPLVQEFKRKTSAPILNGSQHLL